LRSCGPEGSSRGYLGDGSCHCNTAAGYVKNADGLCEYTRDCGLGETRDAGTGGCRCDNDNGYIRTIVSGMGYQCLCNVANGYFADEDGVCVFQACEVPNTVRNKSGECVCNANTGYADDGNGGCVCDSANNWYPDPVAGTCVRAT
jgi:hypothetical protein